MAIPDDPTYGQKLNYDPTTVNWADFVDSTSGGGGGSANDDNQALIDFLNSIGAGGGGGGGGGGASGPSDLDYAMFEWAKIMDQEGLTLDQKALALQELLGVGGLNIDQGMYQRTLNQDQFNNAMGLLQYALSVGDLDLARQAQASADYWQGQSNALDQYGLNLTNQGQQLNYNLGLQDIAAQNARTGAQLGGQFAGYGLEAGLGADASAFNKAMGQEDVVANQMSDWTSRFRDILSGQVNQYANETQRAGTQGDLALRNNQFLLDASTSPRDLPSIFFMQRGIAPDWDTMAAGGTPAQGQALAPMNPLSFFDNLQTMPDFNALKNNPYANQAGQYIGGYTPQSAQGLMGLVNQGAQMGQSFASSAMGPTMQPPPFVDEFQQYLGGTPPPPPPTIDPTKWQPPFQASQQYDDLNPNGAQGGVPIYAIKPGWNLSTVGGSGTYGKNFANGLTVHAGQGTAAYGPDDFIPAGQKVWVKAPDTWGQL